MNANRYSACIDRTTGPAAYGGGFAATARTLSIVIALAAIVVLAELWLIERAPNLIAACEGAVMDTSGEAVSADGLVPVAVLH